MNARQRATAAYRLALTFTWFGLVYKWRYFGWIAHEYFEVPLDHPSFPAFLEDPATFLHAYSTAVALVGLAILTPVLIARALVIGAFIAVSVLCLHLGSYNDATFTTTWWALVWLAWFGGNRGAASETSLRTAGRFATAVVSIVLLGGAVGKWTSEWWSGRVLYEIYFLDRDFWLFNYLRTAYSDGALTDIAKGYARLIILVESAGGLGLWLLPPRVGAWAGAAIFIGIAVLSNPLLFSVTLSMVGLCCAVVLCEVRSFQEAAGVGTSASMTAGERA